MENLPANQLKINSYRLIVDGLDDAIKAGLRRALKHSDEQVSDKLLESMAANVGNYVSNHLSDVIDWESTDTALQLLERYEQALDKAVKRIGT